MYRKSIAVSLVIMAFVLSGSELLAKTYLLTSSSETPAASGKVEVKKDKNGNTDVTIKVDHLAPPGLLTPSASVYVVWFQDQTSAPESQGQLKVEKSLKGEFKATTQAKRFDVLVTAENDPMAKIPSGQIVLRGTVQE
jgi:hypothetical protein